METSKINIETLPPSLQGIFLQQEEENRRNIQEIAFLNERINLLLAQLYGKKSEKFIAASGGEQLTFMEETKLDESLSVLLEETIDVPSHTRKKPGRKPLPPELPRREVIHDLKESEKQCACDSTLSRMGEETSEQLGYIPAKIEVIRHIRPKYTCKTCEGVEENGTVIKIATLPKQIIPKSIASPSLLAQIVTAKFVDSLPFYRQEKQFSRLGVDDLSRSNMAKWTIRVASVCTELLELLHQDILSGPLINIDETTVQVLKEEKRSPSSKSYMWVLRGGTENRFGVYFYYSSSRSSITAQGLLKDYKGVVQSDGYVGYDFLTHSRDIDHLGCWAHSRRKFVDVIKAKGKYKKQKTKSGYAERAIQYIAQLYRIEHQADEEKLSNEQRVKRRKTQSKPLLEEFHSWLEELSKQTPPKGLLGKAVFYALNQWEELTGFLKHGHVPLDNNLVENAIRPFTVGRKNWLFCDTPEGAEANAGLYSLIETARANKLNPFEYLQTLFERLPLIENDQQLKMLLPQYFDPDKLKVQLNELT